MASAIKGMVSKNKIRYKEDGFDLDLSYISRNIIAMGFPAEKLERFYRNHIDDVVRFFETKHKNRYQIYNLCAESKRRYDTSKFQCRVVEDYAFQDHNPPPFELLKPFCEDVHKWLTQDRHNVIAIHCKAGKGRTGVMICAYLIHAGECEITDDSGSSVKISGADKALEYYGRHRTHDKKGVTIPSQKRYVYYYEELVKHRLDYQAIALRLCSINLNTIPISNGGTFTLICEIIQLPKQKLKTYEIEVKKGLKFLQYPIPDDLVFRGDIKIEFYIKNKIKKEKIFQFCFNTFFVKSSDDNHSFLGTHSFSDHQTKRCSISTISNSNDNSCSTIPVPITNGYSNGQIYTNQQNRRCFERKSCIGKELQLVLGKDQLDKAYKDKANRTFTSDFKVGLTFSKPSNYRSSPSPDILCLEKEADQENRSTDNDSGDDTEDEEEDDYYDSDEDNERGGYVPE